MGAGRRRSACCASSRPTCGEKDLSRLFATDKTLTFFRERRAGRESTAVANVNEPSKPEAPAEPAGEPEDKAKLLYGALVHNGYRPRAARRALEALSDRVETESVDKLEQEALATLSSATVTKTAPAHKAARP